MSLFKKNLMSKVNVLKYSYEYLRGVKEYTHSNTGDKNPL